MTSTQIKKHALRINEFYYWIEATCESNFNDEDSVTSYIEREWSDQQIIDEMKYFLSCYHEEGHTLNCELIGEFGAECKADAKKTVKTINGFLKKYK